MSEPIVSPWLIYWFSVYCKVQTLMRASLVLLAIIAGAALLFYVLSINDRDEDIAKIGKVCKRIVIAFGVVAMLNILMPSKELALAMIVAQNVTPQRIEYVTESTGKAVDDGIDYFVDKIIEAADKWEERKSEK